MQHDPRQVDYESVANPNKRWSRNRILIWCGVALLGISMLPAICERLNFALMSYQHHQLDEQKERGRRQFHHDFLVAGLERFKQDLGRYPTTDEGLVALVKPPANLLNWQGPYSQGIYIDYIYRCPGAGGKAYELFYSDPDTRPSDDSGIPANF